MDFFTGQQRTVMTKCSIVYLHLQNKSFVLLVHIRPEEYTKLNKASSEVKAFVLEIESIPVELQALHSDNSL